MLSSCTFKVMVYEKSQFKAENDKTVNYQVLDFAHTIPVVIGELFHLQIYLQNIR